MGGPGKQQTEIVVKSSGEAIACKTCGQMQWVGPLRSGMAAHCVRCGSRIAKRTAGGLHITGALALAAIILYIPANIFPILLLNF